ncbi:olfactory receptor 5G3-like [Hyperolius riggenbachi]|uniref:olfactory receptor 5G3-like n=1 Tax=Hyperolius riggenbachi TaxID=752182 RepID=UPI0035A35F97
MTCQHITRWLPACNTLARPDGVSYETLLPWRCETGIRDQIKNNQSQITEVVLLGFQSSKGVSIFLFTLILVVYIFTLGGNILIITLVLYGETLHTPMYVFLTQLSVTDIILSTDVIPNLLYVILQDHKTMSFINCIAQQNIFSMIESSECLLVTAMSYDRYLAICKPLHYSSIMSKLFCAKLIIVSWLLSLFIVIIDVLTITCMDFCGPNIIDHIFCDVLPLLKLSCSDTFIVQLELILLSTVVVFLPFVLIIVSYTKVIFTILKIPSTVGKQKAFSTCSSHLTVVSIFYVTLICTYGFPSTGEFINLNKPLALLYTVGTPLGNPLIYSLRNKDIKITFKRLKKSFVNLY